MIEVAARADVEVDLEPLVRRAIWTCEELGVRRASMGLVAVDAETMAALNRRHRGHEGATDVLSFPIDGPDLGDGWPEDGPPPELGDVVVCPEAAADPLTTLVTHGVLHLLGHDHDTDDGEMLSLQDALLKRAPA